MEGKEQTETDEQSSSSGLGLADASNGDGSSVLAEKPPSGDAGAQGMSSKVAEHYNAVPDKGVTARLDSRILYLRNFNNWIKSMLIGEFLEKLRESGCSHATVLDLCCGKGGDLLKWKNGNIAHLVATDIAQVSLEQCQRRYNELEEKAGNRQRLFTAEFILADSSRDRLLDRFSDKNIRFDLTSCQFSFHYSFESEPQARQMIRNAIERLRPGGYFIGTLPDANRIMHCLRQTGTGEYKNEVLRLEYGDKEALKSDDYCPSVYGASFHFSLDTQVNCPEYLVHFPIMKKLLEECGMEFVYSRSFPEQFSKCAEDRLGRDLLQKIKALESYPPGDGASLCGGPDEYVVAKAKIEDIRNEDEHIQRPFVGTLSKSEWEVAAMYLVFAFRKR